MKLKKIETPVVRVDAAEGVSIVIGNRKIKGVIGKENLADALKAAAMIGKLPKSYESIG